MQPFMGHELDIGPLIFKEKPLLLYKKKSGKESIAMFY